MQRMCPSCGSRPRHKGEPYCLECKREKGRAYYRANREKMVVKSAEIKRRMYAAVIKKLGGRCACCGDAEPLHLQIDHIDGGGTALYGRSPHAEYRRIAADPEGSGCQVLCANCHQVKTRGATCPHLYRKADG